MSTPATWCRVVHSRDFSRPFSITKRENLPVLITPFGLGYLFYLLTGASFRKCWGGLRIYKSYLWNSVTAARRILYIDWDIPKDCSDSLLNDLLKWCHYLLPAVQQWLLRKFRFIGHIQFAADARMDLQQPGHGDLPTKATNAAEPAHASSVSGRPHHRLAVARVHRKARVSHARGM